MEPLEKLWSYMQEDMQADRIDAEIRRSPLRQKLEKTRDFIMEQQKNYKDMEEHVAVSLDRKDAIRDALERSREQLAALQEKYKNLPESDLDSVKSLMADVDKLRKTIQSYEQEMRRLHKEGNELDNKARTIRHETAVAKQDFDRMRAVYNSESKEKKAELEKQRAKADAMLNSLDPDLLAAYNTVKKHITPPLARLIGGQCSGCNTSQPSAALRKIDAGVEIVECETCGRILIKE
ncbi:MAG: hypothetical protein IJ246_07930 [Clostridia bacterium]|nr:hypothetical protein [Clostridia bacterium]